MDSSTSLFGQFHYQLNGVPGVFIIITEIPVYNANSVERNLTPRSEASDPGLHCFYGALGINVFYFAVVCQYSILTCTWAK